MRAQRNENDYFGTPRPYGHAGRGQKVEVESAAIIAKIMTKRIHGALFMSGLFLGLAIVAFFAARNESATFVYAPKWGAPQVESFANAPVAIESLQADYAVIDACLRLVLSVKARVLPPRERRARAFACQAAIGSIVKSAPTNAYGHYALAEMAHVLGQEEAMLAGLRASYASAPYEAWIAMQRVELAETVLARLPAALLAAHRHDLAVLLQSARGMGPVIERYKRDPAFRPRLTAILEQLPNETQRRFLQRLQAEAG